MTRERVHWPSQAMIAVVMLGYWMSGGNLLVSLAVAAALLLAPWIPWRYNPGRRLGEWLYILIAVPFVMMALSEGAVSASALLLSNRFTQLSTAYLLCLAVQELYRGNSRRKSLLVHGALLGVLFHVGMGYELKLYPVLVAVYLVAVLFWLREATGRSSPVPWADRLWPVVGFGVGLCIAILVAGALFVALPRAERAVDRMYNTMMFGGMPSLMWPVRESELGSLGPMFGSSAIMARVTGQNPLYLRSMVMMTYEHNRWLPFPEKRLELQLAAEKTALSGVGANQVYRFAGPPPPGDPVVGSILEDTYTTVLAPYGTWAVASDAGPLKASPEGVLYATARGVSLEMPLAWYPAAPEDCSGKSPDDPKYLDVPADMRGELETLARQIVADRANPVDQAEAIRSWLQTNCTYELSPPAGPEHDRLETFLFRNHAGYCEYFATAMALMLRTLGVRTRYLLGYMVREKNGVGGYWVVRGRDAHAWVEAYIPGRGWSTWDPTPPAEATALAEEADSTSWLRQVLDQYGLWFVRFWAAIHSGNWRHFVREGLAYMRDLVLHWGEATGWSGAVVLLAWFGWHARKGRLPWGRRTRSGGSETDPTVRFLQQVLHRVERRLARTGLVRGLHETLPEFAGRAGDSVLDRLVVVYCEVRYGGQPLAPDSRNELQHMR